MKLIKPLIKRIHTHFHKRWVKAHFRKFKSFNKCLPYSVMVKLGDTVPGAYKFVAANCDDRLAYRLLEMGFVPNEEVIVIENTGHHGNVMVKVKGSKIALSHGLADKILLKRK